MKKNYFIIFGIIFCGITLLVLGYYFLYRPQPEEEIVLEGKCEINKMIFYYADRCPACRKVKKEKTISKLKELGVKITEINTDREEVKHQIQAIPAFVIEARIYEGYKTFEELKTLLKCQ